MQARTAATLLVIIVVVSISAGCLDRFYEKPAPLVTSQTPTATPTQESLVSTLSPADMALQPSDLPPDYFIKDRTVAAYDQQTAISHELGWRQGYSVAYYRMNLVNEDITGITQTLSVYPLENMNKIFSVEKDNLLAPEQGMEKYEIPFPVIGDKSIAIRETDPDDPYKVVTYTVLFISKNVDEKITMTGSTTDYEVLRSITKIAAARIR